MTSEEFWNNFNGAWGVAQNHFGEYPEERERWLKMRDYISKLEVQVFELGQRVREHETMIQSMGSTLDKITRRAAEN